jgi:hypothetical protein
VYSLNLKLNFIEKRISNFDTVNIRKKKEPIQKISLPKEGYDNRKQKYDLSFTFVVVSYLNFYFWANSSKLSIFLLY